MLCGYLYQVVSKRYPTLLSLLVLACVALDERDIPSKFGVSTPDRYHIMTTVNINTIIPECGDCCMI